MQNDAVNGKSSPLSATAAVPGQHDASPLADAPALSSKLAAAHPDVAGQQFRSPRLQQLLGNRTAAAAGPQNPAATAIESGDGLVPADVELAAAVKLDNNDETVDV